MKILIISGFLGAGKTTFIQEMAKITGKEFVILENEYGEIGIDGKLLGAEDDSAPNSLEVWELSQGCICCSIKADFSNSILTIANSLDPEYLVVEPTGVGKLGNIIDNISKITYDRIKLMSPVTIIDANSFYNNRKNYTEIFEDQIKNAGTVVISKLESHTQDEINNIISEIEDINSNASITHQHYTKMNKEWWNRILQLNFDRTIEKIVDEEADFESLSLKNLKINNENELIFLLEAMSFGIFGDVYRSKGYCNIGNNWLHFEYVDKSFSITGISPMDEEAAVFIGKDINKSWIREAFGKIKPKKISSLKKKFITKK